MKHIILAAALTGLAVSASAATTASAVGTYNNLPSLVVDGFVPAEFTSWTDAANMWWSGQEGANGVVVTLDFGSLFEVSQLTVSLDNNDSYQIDYSTDGNSWNALWFVASGTGNVGVFPGGMDTLSSDPLSAEYIGTGFSPVGARYLRAYAVNGDGAYSIGEISATLAPVPEPGTMALLLSGLFVIAAAVRRST